MAACWLGDDCGGDQAAIEQHRGAVDGFPDLPFETHVAPLGAEITAQQIGQFAGQNLPQPADEFGLGGAPEAGKAPVRIEKGLLNKVGRIDLALETLTDLHAGQQEHVTTIRLQQSSERRGITIARFAQHLFRVRHHLRCLSKVVT